MLQHNNLDLFDHSVREMAYADLELTDDQILERAVEILQRRVSDAPMTRPDDTRMLLSLQLVDLQHEVFGMLLLDTRHRLIGSEELFRGTVDGCAVYPREVVKCALSRNASAVVFYHNHPSGVAEPSQADLSLTRRLKEALALVDVRTLDHFVLGAGESVSLAERGLM